MVVCENPSRSAVCEILRPARLAPTTIPRSKSLKSPFFARFGLGEKSPDVLLLQPRFSVHRWTLFNPRRQQERIRHHRTVTRVFTNMFCGGAGPARKDDGSICVKKGGKPETKTKI